MTVTEFAPSDTVCALASNCKVGGFEALSSSRMTPTPRALVMVRPDVWEAPEKNASEMSRKKLSSPSVMVSLKTEMETCVEVRDGSKLATFSTAKKSSPGLAESPVVR